jgi:hypothetical protein
MHRVKHSRWLALALLVVWGTLPTFALAAPTQRPFNQLSSLAVMDDGSIQLFGTYNPLGPREAIPYDEFFIDAFALPEDRPDQPSPGFTLDLPANVLAQWDVMAQSGKFQSFEDKLQDYLSHDDEANNRFLDSSFTQALTNVRDAIQAVLQARGYTSDQIQSVTKRIHDDNDLRSVIAWMHDNGLNSKSDDDLLTIALTSAVEKFKRTKGNIFVYPSSAVAQVFGIPGYAEPKFYNIDPNTQLARTVFEADVALKRLTADNTLKHSLPFHMTSVEWNFRQHVTTGYAVINIRPGRINIASSSDGRVLSFGDTAVAIHYGPKNPSMLPTPEQQRYAEFLTGHFDDYSDQIAPLWIVRELYKVVAAVRYLRFNGVHISARPNRNWTPPPRVQPIWVLATMGDGNAYSYKVQRLGGVYLRVVDATNVTSLPSDSASAIRDTAASAQLDAVVKSNGSGVCFDVGCAPGTPLGAIRIGNNRRGSAGLSEEVLQQMRARPDLGKLLDDEQNARKAWMDLQDAVLKKEADLASTSDATKKGRLQVELANQLIESSKAEQLYQYHETRVEEGATLQTSPSRAAALVRQLDGIAVPSPLPSNVSVKFSRRPETDEKSARVLAGLEDGIAVLQVSTELFAKIDVPVTMIMAAGKSFIAAEDAADIYLIKEEALYRQASGYLRNPETRLGFTAIVRTIKEGKPLPAGANAEMVAAARAILDPKLGNSAFRIAGNALLSPEARSAAVSKFLIALAAFEAGEQAKDLYNDIRRVNDPIYNEAMGWLQKAAVDIQQVTDPADRAVLEKGLAHANDIISRSYRAKGRDLVGVITEFIAEPVLERLLDEKVKAIVAVKARAGEAR